MAPEVFVTRAASGQPLGLVATRPNGCVALHAVSRDTFSLTVMERGRRPLRRAVSRRGSDVLLVVAAIAGAPA
jgi:hypothetical protein